MADTARAYYDTLRDLAGDPARRARAFAGRVREDLRSGSEGLKSGAEQVRSHGSRTAADIGRLVKAELDAGLTRIGVATQADLDDLNLRLEHSENQIRELRIRLAETEAAAAAKSAEHPAAPQTDTDAPPRASDRAEPRDEEEDA